MDVAFPYKEAITKAYGQSVHVTTAAHVASQFLLYTLEEKAKGQSSILYGKANLRDSSFRHTLQSNS